ncbi:VOC family protein [Amycolatopsis sp. CA-230715]|uniref:VOC family protein n=1 Tax=Amycolatopsis sp. CA-230715 TaxID=2745196 RepID=UPI002F3E36D5
MTPNLTIDCADPVRLAEFWREALDYQAGDTPESIVDPEGCGLRLRFQQVPEPKTVKNRMHLDLTDVGGGPGVPLAERTRRVIAKAERLVAAGATVLQVLDPPGMDFYSVVLRDPEGNEFCVK